MSKFTTTNNKSKKAETTKTTDDHIDALFVMGGVKVIRDENKKIVGYACYCDVCKVKSSSGNGGIIYPIAENLLDHRKMTAHKCPAGCGMHVCEGRSTIIRHIIQFHEEIHATLEKKGLDPIKSWITPDYPNNTYKLGNDKPKENQKLNTNSKPDFEDKSPLEQSGIILSMTPPKQVFNIAPSPVQQTESPVPFIKTEKEIRSIKSWSKYYAPTITPFNEVMAEQLNEHANEEPDEPVVHYAQEDYRKEKQCSDGINCIKKDRPFACPYNHDGKGDIIQMGTILTDDILCPYERPPFIRCYNGRCTKIHLEHRAEFIEKEKKCVFEKKKQLTTDTIQHKLENEPVVSSVVSINNEGMSIMVTSKDAIAIATAQLELDGTILNIQTNVDTDEGEWFTPTNRKNKYIKKPTENDDKELTDIHKNTLLENQNKHSSFVLEA
jgi:hypothetical protein